MDGVHCAMMLCGEEGEEQKEDCILFVGDLARGIEDYELEQHLPSSSSSSSSS
jgi:hypothetical protein